MSEPILEIGGITKAFRGLRVLDGVHMTLAAGEIVGLIGDNGAGKTTTLRSVMGEVRPDEGEIRIGGTATSADPTARRRVGYVAQDAGLYPDLTGRENLEFLAVARGLPADSAESSEQIDTALALADLGDASDRLAREYSGGMGRRLALAGAFLGGPPLVILDEAFQGLDPGAVIRFRDRLEAFGEGGGGALVCSHDLSLLARVSARVLHMTEGKVAQELPGGDLEALERCFSSTD